jgi:hypothetical protein
MPFGETYIPMQHETLGFKQKHPKHNTKTIIMPDVWLMFGLRFGWIMKPRASS